MALHVIPVGDASEHLLRPDCWCGPRIDKVDRSDGSHGWLIEHVPSYVGPPPEPDGTDSSTP